MPNIGPTELIIVLVLVVIIFGVGKLPEVGGALGKSIKEFRKNSDVDDAKAKEEAKAVEEEAKLKGAKAKEEDAKLKEAEARAREAEARAREAEARAKEAELARAAEAAKEAEHKEKIA